MACPFIPDSKSRPIADIQIVQHVDAESDSKEKEDDSPLSNAKDQLGSIWKKLVTHHHHQSQQEMEWPNFSDISAHVYSSDYTKILQLKRNESSERCV